MKQNQNGTEDIIQLILEDHKPLKRLIKVLKSDSAEFPEKQVAFEELAPTLVCHAKPEEQSWYVAMKQQDEMVVEGIEGDVEHQLADQLVEEIKRCQDEDEYMAKCKVLAEMLEHHIKEEEEEMLPDYKEKTDIEERREVGRLYLRLREQMIAEGADDAPSEALLKPMNGAEQSAQTKM